MDLFFCIVFIVYPDRSQQVLILLAAQPPSAFFTVVLCGQSVYLDLHGPVNTCKKDSCLPHAPSCSEHPRSSSEHQAAQQTCRWPLSVHVWRWQVLRRRKKDLRWRKGLIQYPIARQLPEPTFIRGYGKALGAPLPAGGGITPGAARGVQLRVCPVWEQSAPHFLFLWVSVRLPAVWAKAELWVNTCAVLLVEKQPHDWEQVCNRGRGPALETLPWVP